MLSQLTRTRARLHILSPSVLSPLFEDNEYSLGCGCAVICAVALSPPPPLYRWLARSTRSRLVALQFAPFYRAVSPTPTSSPLTFHPHPQLASLRGPGWWSDVTLSFPASHCRPAANE